MCKHVVHGASRHVVFGTRQEDTLHCVITVVNKVVSTVTCALQCFCFEVM